MISRNLTILNKDLVFANLVKSARKNLIPKFILALIILSLGCLIMVNGILISNNLYIIFGIFFEICGIAYVAIVINSYIKTPKDIIKSNPEIENGDINFQFTFKEESFEAIITNNGKKRNVKYSYSDLKKIKEYEKRYEIITKEQQIFYIFKDGFKEEKSEEIFRLNLDKKKKKIINKIKK